MVDPLTESWLINDRINRYLLDAIAPEHLATIGPTKGRSIGATFAHLHNVRLMWLAAAGARIPPGVTKFEADSPVSIAALARALTSSGEAIGALIESALVSGGRVKGFKPHVQAFVGYMISHESHHRGQMLVALKGASIKLDKKVAYGIWEWGSR